MNNQSKSRIFAIVAAIVALSAVTAVVFVLFSNNEQDTQPIGEILELAEVALDESEYRQALTYFRLVIEREPFEPRGYTGAAEAYLGLDEAEQAEEILRQGLEVLPDSAQVNTMLQEIETIMRQPFQDSPQETQSEDSQPAPPEDGSISQPTSESRKFIAVMQTFYEELNSAISRHGISYDWEEPGISFAGLVDFDNDGIPELIYAINNPYIWFGEGIPDVNFYYGYIINHYHEGTITEFVLDVARNGIERIATSRDGTSYLVFGITGGWGARDDWFTIRDGQFVSVLAIMVEIVTDFDEVPSYFDEVPAHFELFINNAFVEEADWEDIPELMARPLSEFDIVDEHRLPMKWEDPFGDAVLPLLDELRAMIRS